MVFQDLGRIPFDQAFAIQEKTVAEIASGRRPEQVYLLEHPPVFTIGRSGSEENLLSAKDFQGRSIPLVRINRGGDITFHGPGQLVGYPHLDLNRRGRDIHRYLRDLEEALIRAVGRFDIDAYRKKRLTGVWSDLGKLASIGVGVRRWITMHGFALNVSTDLRYFRMIHPCGIEECPVTSLEQLLDQPVPMEEVRSAVIEEIRRVFFL